MIKDEHGHEIGSAWERQSVLILTAVFCCTLWGSAHSCIKAGYRLFRVEAADIPAQLLFAGVRFFLAGALVILAGSLLGKKFLRPRPGSLRPIMALASTQTILQYVFFYIGLAHASAIRSSIINGAGTFVSILMAVFIFHYEKLTRRKVVGSLLGFMGVILVETVGQTVSFGFAWNGEGFVIIAMVMSSLAGCLIKKYSRDFDPVMLSGYQFMLGGAIMSILAWSLGGRLTVTQPISLLLILYMAFISSAAYTLWSILMKYHPVSSVSMFTFVTPVAGVIISSLVLDEQGAFNIYTMAALLLVCAGILVVFHKGKGESVTDRIPDQVN